MNVTVETKINKHLELLQWCIANESEYFPISYTFNIGQSWVHALGGDITINCIEECDIDDVIAELSKARAEITPETAKEKRKQALLKELAELEGK